MSQLLMSMIAILLFVGVVTGGINYVNQDGMNISKDASVINSAYLAIKADVANYSIKQPETPSSLDQVYPQSVYYPSLPGKMNFKSLTKNASDEIYVCISVVKNPTNFGSTSRLKRDRSTDRIFINNTCGATTDQIYDNLSSSYYLTIYL